MEIDEQPNTLGVPEGIRMSDQTHVLRRIASGLTLVRLRARVRRCPAVDFPFVRPVAVVIAANAGASADRLTVLTPQSVGGLSIDKAYILVNITVGRAVQSYTRHAPSGLTIGMM